RYDELNELLSDPDVVSDPKRLRALSKEQSGITAPVETYREYKNVNEQINETKDLLGEKLDDEMREMAKEVFAELQKEKADLEERLKLLL
ncbi:PCRF domain-containing protein, partial [Listeria monocytogenes]|uniref:PCRF domain-containing protein n=1 Tax=Listeria monocytogenes TaxID=1639 RepID=UPI001F179623